MEMVLPLSPPIFVTQAPSRAGDEAHLIERARAGEIGALDELLDIGTFNFLAVTMALVAMALSWRATQRYYKFGWQLAHKSAGVLVLMWSAVFLLISIGVWPVRAQFNQSLDRELEIGEIAWMREQIAKTKTIL